MTKNEILQYWFDEIWVKGNLDAVEQMLGPNTESHGLIDGMDLRTTDYCDLVSAIRGLINDIVVKFSHAIEQDGWLAVRTVIDAKRVDNGAPIQVTGQVFVRFDGRRIAEIYSHLDFFSLFEKLGQLPPDALPICLTGQRLQWA